MYKADPDVTVREVIEAYPQTESFFEELGLDDCCRQFTLREISRMYRHDLEDILRQVEALAN